MEFIILLLKFSAILFGATFGPFWIGMLTGSLKRAKITILNPHLSRVAIGAVCSVILWGAWLSYHSEWFGLFCGFAIFTFFMGLAGGALHPNPAYFMPQKFRPRYPPPE